LTDKQFILCKIKSLREGASFGDEALHLRKGRRKNTIRAEKTTHIGVISREAYNKCFKKKDRLRKEAIINFLHCIPAFSGLSRAVIVKIQNMSQNLKYKRNQLVA